MMNVIVIEESSSLIIDKKSNISIISLSSAEQFTWAKLLLQIKLLQRFKENTSVFCFSVYFSVPIIKKITRDNF